MESRGRPMEALFCLFAVRGVRDDAEDVDVALASHLPPRHASKEDHADGCWLCCSSKAGTELLPICALCMEQGSEPCR